jgi:hypothetical protein
MATECSLHHVPLALVPAEPRSRCPNCHYMTRHLHFDRCRECGARMEIEQPEPECQCPLCARRGGGEG